MNSNLISGEVELSIICMNWLVADKLSGRFIG